jgi:hypothetical protein
MRARTLQLETIYPSETTGEYVTLGICDGLLFGFLAGLLLGNFFISLLVGMIPGAVLGIALYRRNQNQNISA